MVGFSFYRIHAVSLAQMDEGRSSGKPGHGRYCFCSFSLARRIEHKSQKSSSSVVETKKGGNRTVDLDSIFKTSNI